MNDIKNDKSKNKKDAEVESYHDNRKSKSHLEKFQKINQVIGDLDQYKINQIVRDNRMRHCNEEDRDEQLTVKKDTVTIQRQALKRMADN